MLAYLNGQFMRLQYATIPVWDYGFTMGVAVTEQLRTFNGQIHCLDYHLERLSRGLDITGIDAGMTIKEIGEIATDLSQKNYAFLHPGQDLGVGITITPGGHPGRAPEIVEDFAPETVLIYATPLAFGTWVSLYEQGIKLATVKTREIPDQCVPRELKCRSRMHYYLADREAAAKTPGAKALLMDIRGFVAEGTIASVVMVKDGTIIAPLRKNVLPSVSVRYLEETLCPSIGVPFKRQNITVAQLKKADELLWLSTSSCVLPIAELDGIEIGHPGDRHVYWKIVDRWSQNVGLHIVEQAKQASC